MRDSRVNSRSDALTHPVVRKEKGSGVLNRIAHGDLSAANECISIYGDMVWSISKASTNSTQAAEDATCNIFKDVWQLAKNFQGSGLEEKAFIAVLASRYLEKKGFRIPN